MKKYRIGIFEEQSGYIVIEAENEKEAETKAQWGLEENGVAYFEDFDITHRNTSIVDNAKEVK